MRLSDIALHDYDWLRGPPSPSAAAKRISRHQREIERDEENAIAIPRELMDPSSKRDAGYTSQQELELLDLEAKRANLRTRELERRRAERHERDARDAELLRQLLASKS